jgi:hypothetical protein
MIEHDKNLATLIILTDEKGTRTAESNNPTNYLSNFGSYIKTLSPEAPADPNNPVFSDGTVRDLQLDGSRPYYGVFNNISVISFTEGSSEIVKVHQNFSGFWNAFFMGEQPRVFNFSGLFLDSKQYPYYQEFMTAYHTFLAGRKCVENKARLKFVYDGKIIEGYILNVNIQGNSESPLSKQFNFQFLVKNEGWLRVNYVPTPNSTYSKYSLASAVNGMSNIHRLIRGQSNG